MFLICIGSTQNTKRIYAYREVYISTNTAHNEIISAPVESPLLILGFWILNYEIWLSIDCV